MAETPFIVEDTIEEEGETDIFAVELTAFEDYTVALLGDAHGGSLSDPLLGIFRPDEEGEPDPELGFFFNDSVELGSDPLVTFVPAVSGTYLFTVGGVASDDSDSPTGDYTLMIDNLGSEIFDDLLGGIA